MLNRASTLQTAVELLRERCDLVSVPVEGGSMHPLLQGGDLVSLDTRKVPVPGSIVAFRREGQLIVHRVLAVDSQTCLEMGDASLATSEVNRSDVLGVAVALATTDGRSLDLVSRFTRLHAGFSAWWFRRLLRCSPRVRSHLGRVPRLIGLLIRRRSRTQQA